MSLERSKPASRKKNWNRESMTKENKDVIIGQIGYVNEEIERFELHQIEYAEEFECLDKYFQEQEKLAQILTKTGKGEET